MSRRAPIAWAALVLAMLAHALAVHFLAALVAWSTVRMLRRGWRNAAGTLAWWYGVPVAAYGFFYLGFLRGMKIGGGPPGGAVAPLANAFAAASGIPAGVPVPAIIMFAIAVTALGGVWLAARGSDQWVLYLVGIVVSPLAVILFHPAEFYAERYFIVSATLWLLLAARLLAWLATRGPRAAAVVALTLAAFLFGNAFRTVPLLRHGRGAFRDAIRYMTSHSSGDVVRVTSDHDFRNRMVVEYYAPRVRTDRSVRYVNRRERTLPGPDWYIAHLPPPPGGVPQVVTDVRGRTYRFEIEFPSNPFSGIPWRLYRRAQTAGAGL